MSWPGRRAPVTTVPVSSWSAFNASLRPAVRWVLLEPRVRPLVYRLDDFAVTLWVYYESGTAALSATDYADGLARLHAGMRRVDIATPRFTDRIAQAEKIVAEPESSPALAAQDRELLVRSLADLRQAIDDRNASEQLLHGEPHPGNVLRDERRARVH